MIDAASTGRACARVRLVHASAIVFLGCFGCSPRQDSGTTPVDGSAERRDGGEKPIDPSDGDFYDPSDYDFYGLLRLTDINFPVAATYEEQAERSEVIVRGRFVGVADGRSFIAPRGKRDSLPTVVLQIQVDDVLKGEVGPVLHVEYIVAGFITAQLLLNLMPTHELIVFGNDISELQELWQVFDEGNGVAQGARLYEMVTPQGLVVSMPDGSATQPLLAEIPSAVIPMPLSFAKVAEAVR